MGYLTWLGVKPSKPVIHIFSLHRYRVWWQGRIRFPCVKTTSLYLFALLMADHVVTIFKHYSSEIYGIIVVVVFLNNVRSLWLLWCVLRAMCIRSTGPWWICTCREGNLYLLQMKVSLLTGFTSLSNIIGRHVCSAFYETVMLEQAECFVAISPSSETLQSINMAQAWNLFYLMIKTLSDLKLSKYFIELVMIPSDLFISYNSLCKWHLDKRVLATNFYYS